MMLILTLETCVTLTAFAVNIFNAFLRQKSTADVFRKSDGFEVVQCRSLVKVICSPVSVIAIINYNTTLMTDESVIFSTVTSGDILMGLIIFCK